MTSSPRPTRCLALIATLGLGACAINDSRIAERAPAELTGLSETDLESCLGVPDQHASFGRINIDTYSFASSSSTSYTIPVVGGLGMSNGGNCKLTFRLEDGRVARVLYSGEKNATLAPDAYCAPVLRTCIAWLAAHPQPRYLKLPPEAASRPVQAVRTDMSRTAGETGAVIAPGTGIEAPRSAPVPGGGVGDGGTGDNPVGTATR